MEGNDYSVYIYIELPVSPAVLRHPLLQSLCFLLGQFLVCGLNLRDKFDSSACVSKDDKYPDLWTALQ